MRGFRRCGAAALIVSCLATGIASGPVLAAGPGLRQIEVSAKPIERFLPMSDETRFGALEFRGGLELSASTSDFSGLSGLDFASDGRLYAVTDRGYWVRARALIEEGRLVGVADVFVAPILNHAGHPVSGKKWSDAEGLRFTERNGQETALVVFERSNDVRAFAGPDFPLSRSVDVPLPAGTKKMSGRDGAEAIAIAPPASPVAGGMVVIAEVLRDTAGNTQAWIVGGRDPGDVSVARQGGYDVSDAEFLPDGDLLLLERRLGLPLGLSIRIRRIPAAEIRPGRTIDGAVIFEAALGHQIDNMEGLAVTEGPDGETLLALVSDDNLNPLQRTLLLLFALMDEQEATSLPAGPAPE